MNMNSNPRNTFVKVGFEFTAAPKPNLKLANKNLTIYPSPFAKGDFLIEKRQKNSVISKYRWINNNIEPDECGCEVPTPIAKSLNSVKNYYNQFMEFVKESDLTTEINKSYGGLGGCHIHLDLSYLELDVKKLFLKNIAILLSNNPWLNWALNDPNDNVNANSLLCRSLTKEVNDGVIILRKTKSQERKIKKANNALEIFLMDPFYNVLKKYYALRYNMEYDTVELRIFNMPTSLEEHLFHYKIAMSIYNKCLEWSLSNSTIIQNLKHENEYLFLDNRIVKSKLKHLFKELEITPTEEQLEKMFLNIDIRYSWSYDENEAFKSEGVINVEEFYLL